MTKRLKKRRRKKKKLGLVWKMYYSGNICISSSERLNNQCITKHASPSTYFDAGGVGVGLAAGWVGQEDILWFQVSVDNAFGLQHPHSARYLLQEHTDGVLAQRALGCVCEGGKAIVTSNFRWLFAS